VWFFYKDDSYHILSVKHLSGLGIMYWSLIPPFCFYLPFCCLCSVLLLLFWRSFNGVGIYPGQQLRNERRAIVFLSVLARLSSLRFPPWISSAIPSYSQIEFQSGSQFYQYPLSLAPYDRSEPSKTAFSVDSDFVVLYTIKVSRSGGWVDSHQINNH